MRRSAAWLLAAATLVVSAPPGATQPARSADAVRRAAAAATELRVVISIAARRLWVLYPTGDTVRAMPVAVGNGRRLTLAGRTWHFVTPVGIRRVISTEVDPVWRRPDWAYVELAEERGLRLDSVSNRRPHALASGDSLVMRERRIGVVRGGSFTAWPENRDIVVDRTLFMPPAGSDYRAVPGVLGRYRLNLGAAIGIHGTRDTASIGRAATHGCLRVHDSDLEWLYTHVPVGTAVFIH